MPALMQKRFKKNKEDMEEKGNRNVNDSASLHSFFSVFPSGSYRSDSSDSSTPTLQNNISPALPSLPEAISITRSLVIDTLSPLMSDGPQVFPPLSRDDKHVEPSADIVLTSVMVPYFIPM